MFRVSVLVLRISYFGIRVACDDRAVLLREPDLVQQRHPKPFRIVSVFQDMGLESGVQEVSAKHGLAMCSSAPPYSFYSFVIMAQDLGLGNCISNLVQQRHPKPFRTVCRVEWFRGSGAWGLRGEV